MNKLELVPVIEIWENCDSVVFPQKYPYWKYPEEFAKANAACLLINGYEPMKSYAKGLCFYELDLVSDLNLLLQIRKRIDGYTIDEVCPFDGGYVLKVQNEDMLFPQCCGDLSDIQYWKDLSEGESRLFWQGHPQPEITVDGQIITFDLNPDDYDDFVPTPKEQIFSINILDLQQALKDTIVKLQVFSDRIDKLGIENNFKIEKLSDVLVWDIHP